MPDYKIYVFSIPEHCYESAGAHPTMGQEQSFAGPASPRYAGPASPRYAGPATPRYAEYRDPRDTFDYRDYDDYRRKRSPDTKSDNSSTESSGYRSSSTYECHSNRSSKSDYYSIYKNDHYKDINKELYKPVKIKDKRYKLQLLDLEKDELKSARLKSYLSEAEKAQLKTAPKKAGIRNYTPKILSEEEQRKKEWI